MINDSIKRSNALLTLIQRHPVKNFVVITFVFSYLVGWNMNVLLSQMAWPGIMAIYVPRLFIVAGPAVAATVVTLCCNGRAGVRGLLNRILPQQRHMHWIVILPITGIAINLLSFIVAGLSLKELFDLLSNRGVILVLHVVLQTVIIGLGEELGWRGYLLPMLAKRHTLIAAMSITLLVWGVWHLPIFFMGADVVIPWLMVISAATIFLTWVWLKTEGNVFVLAIAHASINSGQFFMENELGGDNLDILLEGWRIYGYCCIGVGLFFLFAMRGALATKFKNK